MPISTHNSNTGGTIVHTVRLPKDLIGGNNPMRGSLLHITYQPRGKVLDVASLFSYIEGLAGSFTLIEDLGNFIEDDLRKALGVTVTIEVDALMNPKQRIIHQIGPQTRNIDL